MTGFLHWEQDWSHLTDWSALGEGSHPAQNPPPLEIEDGAAKAFYRDYGTPFVRDFGLMPYLIQVLGYTGPDLKVFLWKLDLLHQSEMERMAEMMKKKIPPGGTDG